MLQRLPIALTLGKASNIFKYYSLTKSNEENYIFSVLTKRNY